MPPRRVKVWPVSDDVLLHERRGRVALVWLNRPARANALSEALLDALTAGLAIAAGDPDVDAIVISGAGRAFCAGGDLDTLSAWQALSAWERHARYRKGITLARTLAELEVPVVAAVNGAAAGAGLDLALGADLCLAGRSASFVSGFVAVGLVPDLGGSWLLPRVVGLSRARQLVLGGERLDAETACEWGIAGRVVDNDRLIEEAVTMAARVAEQGCRPAYVEAKRALLASTWSFTESLDHAATTQALLMDTAEHQQRAEAFLANSR